MKAKIFSSVSFAVLFLLVLTGFASALSLSNSPNSLDFQSGESHQITITSDGNANFSFSSPEYFTVKNLTSQKNMNSVQYNITFDENVFADGSETLTITAVNSTNSSDTDSVSITLNYDGVSFCSVEDNGNLDIEVSDVSVVEGFGDDDDYWYPLDEVEIEVTLENKGDEDINNIQLEWAIYTDDGEKVVDGDEDDLDLKDGDEEDLIISLKLEAEDFEDFIGTDNYIFYVKATGDDEDTDDETCVSDSFDIEIKTGESFVIVDNIELNSESVLCGDEITLTADVWNIGDDDLDDDEVYVLIYNKDLGINKLIEFEDGINSMDSEEISFTFTVPENVAEKIYQISFTAYEEDSTSDKYIFENEEEDQAEFFYDLTIAKGSCSITPNILVDAELQSDARSGKDLIVKATITNSGSAKKTFFLLASNYEDFASSAVLDKNSVTIEAGESAEVLVTLKILNDADGENGFDLEIVDGSKTFSQPVSVVIEKSSSFNLSGFAISGNNAYLYGIVALNVVLIAGIVFVALRLAKKKPENLE